MYPLVPVMNFLSGVLVCLPLLTSVVQTRTWNVAITALVIWTAIGCFFTGVNTIIWSDNVRNSAPVWCDISEHRCLVINIHVASSLLIRHLQPHISSTHTPLHCVLALLFSHAPFFKSFVVKKRDIYIT